MASWTGLVKTGSQLMYVRARRVTHTRLEPNMRRTRTAALVLGAVTMIPVALVASGPAAAETAGETAGEASYLVLAADAASTDAAIASVEAAGGEVTAVNHDVGLVSAVGAVDSFRDAVAASPAVVGVARDAAIGSVPADVVNARDAVETEGRGTADATPGVSPANDAATTTAMTTTGRRGRPSRPPVTPEPLASRQWDMAMIGATPEGSYAKQQGRPDVLVGIIDTGVDGTHPDIAPNFSASLSRNFTTDIELIDGPCIAEPDASCEDAADVDENGHGTHVAGTVGSPINGIGIAGVAPKVTLVNLRAGQDSGYFFLQATVDALTFAARNGIDVVNMSFYIDPWLFNCTANPADPPEAQAEQRTIIEATQRALDFARWRGVTLVASLGNGHMDLGAPPTDTSSPDYPPGAAYPRPIDNSTCLSLPVEGRGVIAVSSVGPSGAKADYSNHGLEQNDIAAPGGWFRDFFGTDRHRSEENLILAPMPWGVAVQSGLVDPVTGAPLDAAVVSSCTGLTIDTCAFWQYLQGTSMASPHVAGVAALIVSKYGVRDPWRGGRMMSPLFVEWVLKRTATDVACPAPVITYANEGRDASFDAPCVGTPQRNSIYGDGIVNALRAVS